MVIPKVGMIVHMNNDGLKSVGGIKALDEVIACTKMEITSFSSIPCSDAELYALDFDGNPLNKYMINNFDVTENKKS